MYVAELACCMKTNTALEHQTAKSTETRTKPYEDTPHNNVVAKNITIPSIIEGRVPIVVLRRRPGPIGTLRVTLGFDAHEET